MNNFGKLSKNCLYCNQLLFETSINSNYYKCDVCEENFVFCSNDLLVFTLFNLKIRRDDLQFKILVDYIKYTTQILNELQSKNELYFLTVDEFDLDFSDKQKLYNKFKTIITFS